MQLAISTSDECSDSAGQAHDRQAAQMTNMKTTYL